MVLVEIRCIMLAYLIRITWFARVLLRKEGQPLPLAWGLVWVIACHAYDESWPARCGATMCVAASTGVGIRGWRAAATRRMRALPRAHRSWALVCVVVPRHV